MERKHTNTLTFGAMMTALSVVVLLLGSLLPGMRLTVAAIAGMIAALAVLRGGFRPATLLGLTAVAALPATRRVRDPRSAAVRSR